MHTYLAFIVALYGDLLDLVDLARYFAIVITDGDHLNDWLTHMPPQLADAAEVLGYWVAAILHGI